MSETVKPLPRNTVLPVAGVSYRQDVVATVTEGDAILLRHDTTNPRDPNAVTVQTLQGDLLGFVPKTNDLNARLVARTPGGVWAGTVVEVLRKETTGLRIKVGDLVSAGPARFGAALPGLRHRDDGYQDPAATLTAEATTAPVESEPAQPPLVRNRAGRTLGHLVEQVGNRVRVSNGTTVVAYPAAIVEIVDAAGPTAAVAS